MAFALLIKVPIKSELKTSIPFPIPSWLPIALILAFIGFRHETIPLMQSISHGTRAYILNENFLIGFIQKVDIIKILQSADQIASMKTACQWQVVDIKVLEKELRQLENLDEKLTYLSQYYPSLHKLMLRYLSMKEKLKLYDKEC